MECDEGNDQPPAEQATAVCVWCAGSGDVTHPTVFPVESLGEGTVAAANPAGPRACLCGCGDAEQAGLGPVPLPLTPSLTAGAMVHVQTRRLPPFREWRTLTRFLPFWRPTARPWTCRTREHQ